jgi:hypothetical protein
MGSRPYNLVYVKLLWVEPSHPILPVRRAIIRTRIRFSRVPFKIN